MEYYVLESLTKVADPLPLNAEYTRVEALFLKDLALPDACISRIYKVRSGELTAAFESIAAEIAIKRETPPTRIHVYHGTTAVAAASICVTGFDPSYSTIAVYGKGTYASPNPRTALRYCKDVKTKENFSMVFLCKFLQGTFGPMAADGTLDTKTTDYSGNGSTILVTPYRYGIIPEYLICYYQWT
jgi:hypothetical protein